jgi:hypothetical protein
MTTEKIDPKKLQLEARLASLHHKLQDAVLASTNFCATRPHMPEHPTELDFKRQARQFKKLLELSAAQNSLVLAYSDTLIELRPYDRRH